MDESVRPIRYLREYSNYLTPRTGFFSADTWTMIGIYVRNTLLNQVIIVAFFAAALLMPRNWFALSNAFAGWPSTIAIAALLWAIGLAFLAMNVRRLDPHSGDVAPQQKDAAAVLRPPDRWYAYPWGIHVAVVIPWLVAAALVVRPWAEWALLDAGIFGSGQALTGGAPVGAATAWVGGIVGASLLFVLLWGRTDRCWTVSKRGWRQWLAASSAIALGAAMAAVVSAGLAWVVLKVLSLRADSTSLELSWHIVALATPGLLSVLSLAIVAMLGMLGKQLPDEHREWWSRLRTVIHIYAVGWLAWMIVSLYVPWALISLESLGWKSGLTALAGWIATTFLGVRHGPNAEDARKREAETPAATSTSTTVFRYAALAAPYVFVVGLVLLTSIAIDLLYRYNGPGHAYWTFAEWTSHSSGWWTLGCAAVGLLFSSRVDINEFSIHHFYKNRLVRCYLGASRANDRKPDWFTGFDPDDDLRLARFDHNPRGDEAGAGLAGDRSTPPYAGPYPIINCALNLVGGRDLAWQERKATSFVFTPKYCGYDVDRAVLPKRKRLEGNEAYVPTTAFYRRNSGPLLGMAMAISGAAANPNMGRASSPALGFLMTVFNVRLGWWIGNPRRIAAASQPGPPLGLAYTALELFGLTDDERDYVNLSDGGHFDNLGVYELIRRSCRYIIVSDAGQDDRFICEDLGDLVRRCRTDFGVEIDIAVDRIRNRDLAGISQTHCVVGVIHYLNIPKRVDGRLVDENDGPLVPGATPGHEIGYLVYIKPSLTGDEPQDVLEYNRRIPEFPHQSTADQWFDESQFESYRKLGMHAAEQTFSRYQSDDTISVDDVGQLMTRLYRYWYPPSVAIDERSTAHATEYSRIMSMIQQGPSLAGLDHVMFEKMATSAWTLPPRDEFYVCNGLIQLVENVYADLDLEQNWNHPHVAGWMGIFRRWAQQPAFRRTWDISETTYADRFRNFYNDRLRGRQLSLPRGFVAYREAASGRTPAETLANFNTAIQGGASVVELEVRLVEGGDLVVYQSATSDGRAIDESARDGLQNAGCAVLEFKHCLEKLRPRTRLCVVLKSDGIESRVLDALRESEWDVENYALSSSNRAAIQKLRALSSDVKLGLHVESSPDLEQALKEFLLIGADYLAPKESLLNAATLARARDARVLLVPWIVNDPQRLRLFLSHDAVAGVISNDVATALRIKTELS
jgi:glycerophosphoryl diester phosphodiesterase